MSDVYVPKYLRNNQDSKIDKNTYIYPDDRKSTDNYYHKDKNKTDVYVSKYLNHVHEKGLNPYFSFNDENYSISGEVNLMKALQEEQIRMHGVMCTYIVRTDNTIDEIFGESIGSNFSNAFRIEMMPSTTEGMMGRDSIMPFGYNMTDTVELHVAYDRLVEEITKLGIKDRKYPRAGDLIAWDIPGNIMEIRYVEDKVLPFQMGHWSMYNLICQVFNLGQETFSVDGTSDTPDINFLNEFDKTYEYPHSDNKSIREEASQFTVEEPNSWNIDINSEITYEKQPKKRGRKKKHTAQETLDPPEPKGWDI